MRGTVRPPNTQSKLDSFFRTNTSVSSAGKDSSVNPPKRLKTSHTGSAPVPPSSSSKPVPSAYKSTQTGPATKPVPSAYKSTQTGPAKSPTTSYLGPTKTAQSAPNTPKQEATATTKPMTGITQHTMKAKATTSKVPAAGEKASTKADTTASFGFTPTKSPSFCRSASFDTELDQFRSKQQTPEKTYKRESVPSQSPEDETIENMMETLKKIKKTHKRKREEEEEEEGRDTAMGLTKQLEDIDAWEMVVEEVEEEESEEAEDKKEEAKSEKEAK